MSIADPPPRGNGPKASARIFFLAAIPVVAGGLIWDRVSTTAERQALPEPEAAVRESPPELVFPVRAAVARNGDLIKRLETTGVIRAGRELEIHAGVGGMLTEVCAFNGRFVREGEILLRMDDAEQRAAFERAKAGLLNAQIEFRSLSATPFLPSSDSTVSARRIAEENARLDSLTRAYREGDLDAESYERRRRECLASLAYLSAPRGDVIAGRCGLPQATEAFRLAQRALEQTTVAAPFAGVIADCGLLPGMRVLPGQFLLKLMDLSHLYVDAQILEGDVRWIMRGQRARIRLGGANAGELPGTVVRVNPRVDPETRTLSVTIRVQHGRPEISGDPPCAWPGMFCAVSVETAIIRSRLIIPRSALLTRDQRPLVFTVKGSLACWQYVKTGETDDEAVEILSGVAGGDTVIIDGHFTLAHDTRVAVVPDGE